MLEGRDGGIRFQYVASLARLMPLRIRIAGILIAAGAFGPAAAAQPDNVNAVTPGGPGVLTKCRGWVVASSCRTYHHISLPSRIAVGDTITVSFGSHPKEFRFYVARPQTPALRALQQSRRESPPNGQDQRGSVLPGRGRTLTAAAGLDVDLLSSRAACEASQRLTRYIPVTMVTVNPNVMAASR